MVRDTIGARVPWRSEQLPELTPKRRVTAMVPQKIFLTKGVGKHKEKLRSFEAALRKAGIEKYNLVRVSSILPACAEYHAHPFGPTVVRRNHI